MFKNILFLIPFLFLGCVKHHPVEATGQAGLYRFAGSNFSSTNSPCLDGVITVVDHSCAVPMQIEEGSPYVIIQCEKARKGAQPWDKYSIIAVVDPRVEDPVGSTMMCMDPYTRVYIQSLP